MLPDLPPPKLIVDAQGLDELLEDLATQTEIAVDTEADSFFSYQEKVCLIQVTVEDRDYLVDPLADGVDLSSLGPVFADERRTKVFHDGEYDVLILKRDYGFEFAGLFDTRVAAAALGSTNPGLASVLREHFDVELDKAMQRSNWSERPLTDQQIAYARLDTRFLLPLMREQKVELDRRGRSPVVEGECRRLEALVPTPHSSTPDDFVRVKGVRKLKPLERQVMRELYALRETLASERNVPPFRIMSQQALMSLARRHPRSRNELKEVDGFTWKQVRRLGDQVLAAVKVGIDKGPLNQLPTQPRRDGTGELGEAEFELHDRLKTWRKERAQDEEIDSSLVLNRHVMLRIAKDRPQTDAELEAVDGILLWQLEAYGKELVDVVRRFEQDLAAGRIELDARRRRRR